MIQSSSGGAVFLSDLDDYLSPSQACVNPLYGGSETESKESKAVETPSPDSVVVRQRRGRRVRSSAAELRRTPAVSAPDSSKVTASIADCLACSGCVTTAETVLLQDHSLDRLRAILFPHEQGNDQNVISQENGRQVSLHMPHERQELVVIATVSPAAMADLARVLAMNLALGHDWAPRVHSSNEHCEPRDTHSLQLAITSLLVQCLGVDAVIDGNLALKWSMQQAAQEFIEWKRNQPAQDTLQLQQRTADQDAMELEASVQLSNRQQASAVDSSRSPLISSTCPAIVCLVEKNIHECVSLLSHTKSPMAAAAAALQEALDGVASHGTRQHENRLKRILHLAIMPCHDKKLEGSRIDQNNGKGVSPQVQSMVITSTECWTLIMERSQRTKQHVPTTVQNYASVMENQAVSSIVGHGSMPEITSDWRSCLQKLLLENTAATNIGRPTHGAGFLITEDRERVKNRLADEVDMAMDGTPRECDEDMEIEMYSDNYNDSVAHPSAPPPVFPYSSGGYADYIFRRTARELFGVRLDRVPWRPVTIARTTSISPALERTTEDNRNISARVARSRGKRDFWEATLYRILGSNGDVLFSASADDNHIGTRQPVLRFAMAYGMQTIQQALEERGTFDYIEAMACPSGCVNGGGQVQSAALPGQNVGRERPSETQLRIQATRDKFMISQMHSSVPDECAYTGPRDMETTFRKVPPLQLTLGAGKGTAVKDLQW